MKNIIKSVVLTWTLCFSGSLWAAKLQVVSSFSILGDVAQQIGGERVAVTHLVSADSDTHAHSFSANDAKTIAAAQLILLNGLGLENGDLVRAVQQSQIPYATATAGIVAIAPQQSQHHNEHDPHVWHNPVLMQKYAANVAIALIRADPAGAQYYQSQFEKYSRELILLDNEAQQQFNAIPPNQRKVLTGHDSFAYLSARYGIQFIAPQGNNTEAQPSAKTVAAIIRQIKQQNIKAVFTENIKDNRMIQRIAQETGAKIGGKLYSDALSQDANAQTYVAMFRHNVRTMAAAMR